MKYKVVVLGAGPAGLGAGFKLFRQKQVSWKIFEATNRVGGLSSSRVDKNGFTWDLGGHVIFSSSLFFNRLVEKTLGEDALLHKRSSFVNLNGRFIPFPLQNNIHRLPKKAMNDCLHGMIESAKTSGRPRNFREWIKARLGEGLARHFMVPYNEKLWGFPLEEMGYGWIDGRVSLPPIASVKRAIKTGRDATGWGGNATFRFPSSGGTGGLFSRIAEPFIDNIAFRNEAVKIDPVKKLVTFKNGATVGYGGLITTAPLDRLVKQLLVNPPADVIRAAEELRSNSGWMVGIGINRRIKTKRCWLYFPDASVPFYRVTYFSNYSPNNVARPGEQASLLCEISSGSHVASGAEAVRQTIEGLIRTGIIKQEDRKRIVSQWKLKLPYLYPIPSLGRDRALRVIEKYLHSRGIASVGRFGGWRYEKGNMDHSFIAGCNAAANACKRK